LELRFHYSELLESPKSSISLFSSLKLQTLHVFLIVIVVDDERLLLLDVSGHAPGLGVDRLVASNCLSIIFTFFFVAVMFDDDDDDCCIQIARRSLPS
jgi:hypothetical protein